MAISLNQAQRQAVNAPIGPLLIVAGAGSGKTRVLTERIAHLISHHHAQPESILAVTFTNKAASEMKERLMKTVDSKAARVVMGTFHSIGLRILRHHAEKLEYPDSFVVYDADDSKALMKQIIKNLGSRGDGVNPSGVLQLIDRAKNDNISPEQFLRSRQAITLTIDESAIEHPSAPPKMNKSTYEELVALCYQQYQNKLKELGAFDFGDLLMQVVTLFEKFPGVLAAYQSRVQHMLVDEFQDTNLVQYRFIKLLSHSPYSLFAVGDEDQSIYSFRGAQLQNILSFENDFPGTTIIRLEENYRSTKTILDAANSIISKNSWRRPKTLFTKADVGDRIGLWSCADEEDEASRVVRDIPSRPTSLREIAIFYRTNAQSRALEEALIGAGIPYRIFGGLKFFERKEIKDLMAYLRIVQNPRDDIALLRVINTPPRGIGMTSIHRLIADAQANGHAVWEELKNSTQKSLKAFTDLVLSLQSQKSCSLNDLLETILKETSYIDRITAGADPQAESRIENIHELVGMTKKFEREREADSNDLSPLHAFLDHVALITSVDLNSGVGQEEYVSLMTLHIAKGLEFDVVYFTGLEEGLCPHSLSLQDAEGIEEERRLCYVGITRAKKHLILSYTAHRSMFGGQRSSGHREPSRFLWDIPSACIEEGGVESFHEAPHYIPEPECGSFEPTTFQKRSKTKPLSAPQIQLSIGDRVRHRAFGEGVVMELLEAGTTIVTVAFDEFDEPMKLIGSGSKLERLQ